MYGYIYKTTNLVNGKIYIGQHKSDKFDESYLGSGILLNKAILKYGVECFRQEILEVCYSKNELNEREIYWIEYYNSTNVEIGYNMTRGGDGGDTKILLSEDRKNLLSKKTSERMLNTILVKELSSNKILRINRNDFDESKYERFHPKFKYSNASKKKMSNSAKERIAKYGPPNTNPKYKLYGQDGTYIKVHKDDISKYLSQGYITSKEHLKRLRREHRMTVREYAEFKKNKVLMRRLEDNKYVFVDIKDREKYLNMGYIQFNPLKGTKMSEEQKIARRHAHKKMKTTINISKARTKYIYTYNNVDFFGIMQLKYYLNNAGISISCSGIESIVFNKASSCKKFPALAGKIKRRLK